jgi:hypothetical protein
LRWSIRLIRVSIVRFRLTVFGEWGKFVVPLGSAPAEKTGTEFFEIAESRDGIAS